MKSMMDELKEIDRLCELAALHDKIAFWTRVAKQYDKSDFHIAKADELREQVYQILEKKAEGKG